MEIQLTIANNHISYIGNNGKPVMHSKSDNIEIMIREHLKEFFDSLKKR